MGFSKKDNNGQEVRVAKSAFAGLLVKRVWGIFGFSLLALFVIYLCFASTLMRVVPTTSGAGLVPVKGNTFPGGIIPENTEILVNVKNEVKTGHFDKLGQAFIPTENAAVINVKAGPNGEVKWMESGVITVKGKMTEAFFFEDPEKDFLESEYVGVCVSGACKPGEGIIVPKNNIYGVVIDSSVEEVVQ